MKPLKKIIIYALLTVGGLTLMLPLVWMLTVSLSTPGQSQRALASLDAFAEVSKKVYEHPNWDNYTEALRNMGSARAAEETMVSYLDSEKPKDASDSPGRYDPLWKALWTGRIDGAWEGFFNSLANTVVITTIEVVGLILSCSLVGYSFARVRFRGSRMLFIVMLSTMMLPGQVTMIPIFILYRNLGWVDTILPLTVPAFFGSAFFIFMYRQFFSQIPQDVIDSARIDGASYLRIWWSIMLPMCRPVVAITAIFTFMGAWNDFMGPLIYLHSPEKGTLALALNSFRTQFGGVDKAHLLMAGSIMTMIPCVVLFFAAQRHFIKGLNLGAVKG
jgi:ABC-type glycerol-3-phosphate transport system permease component